MRTIRTLLTLFFGLFLLGGIASALAAAYARGRIEEHGAEAADEFDVVAIYGARDFPSKAKALRRWSALSWYGGGTADLRGATPASRARSSICAPTRPRGRWGWC